MLALHLPKKERIKFGHFSCYILETKVEIMRKRLEQKNPK
jgi:hypothetical protein